MIDEALRAFLERGGAMIVGTVGADGSPHAQRAWGCTVVDATTIRVALDSHDTVLREHVAAGGRIAITSADVRTLRSVQLKGRVLRIDEEPTEADLACCETHNDELFTDIETSDHYPRALVERMVPPGYLMAVITVEELFDQTPGPSAGAKVTAGGAP